MRSDEKKCPACAETIKLEAKVCKHCGHTFTDDGIAAEKAKRRASTAKGVGIAAALIGGVVVLGALGSHKNGSSSTNAVIAQGDVTADNLEAEADNMTAAAASASKTKPADGGWTYEDTPDKMRGGTRRVAEVVSTDMVHLRPPYDDNSPTLHIRRDPKFGFDIYFTSQGQPLCRPFMSGHVSIKFDNGPVRTWGCNEAADGSAGIVFFGSAKRLLDKIKLSKTMTVEDDYYDAGRQVFSFKVEGLKW